MDGTSEYGFDSEEAARAWLAGTKQSPNKMGSMAMNKDRDADTIAQIGKDLQDPAKVAAMQGLEKPTTSGPDTPPGYMSKSSASAGIVGSLESTKDNPNPNPMGLPVRDEKPLQVRYIMDGDTPVDVREPAGRKRAVEIINARLTEIQDITIQACKDFTGNIQAQKWLGEVGELYALREILDGEDGREAYLMPDSKAESDLVIIGRREVTTEDTVITDLTVVEISVKSSTKEEVGQRGANARAPILRMLDGKNITLPGVGEVSASSAASIVYDMREQLGYFLTDDVAVKEPGKKKRQLQLLPSGSLEIPRAKQLDRFTPQYQTDYRNNTVYNGVPTRENQGYFERSRLVGADDVDAFKARLTAHIAKNYPAKDQEKQIQIMEHYLSKLKKEVEANPNYTLAELRNFLMENVGEISDNTNPPTDAIIQSDLVGLKFDATNGKPTVSVARADAVRQCIDDAEKAARNKKVGDVVGDKPLDDPESASQTVGDVLNANCYDSDGRMKWKCQFSKFLKPVWIAQARVSKSTGRGGLQFKLNWASPTKCTKLNSTDVKTYVNGI
jgi:hypothetical protein